MGHERATKGRLTRLAGVVAMVAALAACDEGAGGAQAAATPGAPPPPAVTVQQVTLTDVPLTREYAGRTQGAREVQVRARVAGILLERTYVEGQAVAQGDLLFRIDPQPFQVRLNAAEAGLQQSRAGLRQAERNWARVAELWQSRTISARTRDDAQAELDLARAAVAAAEAEVASARIDLGYTTVEAPISGVTSLEDLPEGSLVGTGADNGLLTTITQLDPLHVVFAMPEAERMRERGLLESGRASREGEDGRVAVEIVLGDGSVHPQEGWVDFTASGVDPNTGTIRARAIVPNPDHRLLPGQFVRVRAKGLVQNGVALIPDKALMQGPQGPFVYVVDGEDKAQPRPVTAGALVDGARVIEAGLATGDRVITGGVIKVRPGAPVQAVSATAAAPDGGTGTGTGEQQQEARR
ncbi:efflux RND transporter periplasmic adaptor subunit [Caenispirillum bisanense]|uniref:efflux RND transporter periplasmic adaptor subunit n=1 Tax=Caenispirillum bisanense TaxID=414052 RepID=UPI0031DDFAF7